MTITCGFLSCGKPLFFISCWAFLIRALYASTNRYLLKSSWSSTFIRGKKKFTPFGQTQARVTANLSPNLVGTVMVSSKDFTDRGFQEQSSTSLAEALKPLIT